VGRQDFFEPVASLVTVVGVPDGFHLRECQDFCVRGG
jgi:hypothetical protein